MELLEWREGSHLSGGGPAARGCWSGDGTEDVLFMEKLPLRCADSM